MHAKCISYMYHGCVTQPGKISFNQVASGARAECLSIRAAFRMGSSYVEERIWSDCRDGNNSRRTRLINSVVRRNIILLPPRARPLLSAPVDTNKSLSLSFSARVRFSLVRVSLRTIDALIASEPRPKAKVCKWLLLSSFATLILLEGFGCEMWTLFRNTSHVDVHSYACSLAIHEKTNVIFKREKKYMQRKFLF